MVSFSEIINGPKETKTLILKTQDNTPLELRYLTIGEKSIYEQIKAKAIGNFNSNQVVNSRSRNRQQEVANSLNINVLKQTEADYNAKVYAVRKAVTLGDEDPTEQDVKSLNALIFEEIYEEVRKMNNLDASSEEQNEEEEEIDKFRKE